MKAVSGTGTDKLSDFFIFQVEYVLFVETTFSEYIMCTLGTASSVFETLTYQGK